MTGHAGRRLPHPLPDVDRDAAWARDLSPTNDAARPRTPAKGLHDMSRLCSAGIAGTMAQTAGGLAERLKAQVLKTCVGFHSTVGSNPTPSAFFTARNISGASSRDLATSVPWPHGLRRGAARSVCGQSCQVSKTCQRTSRDRAAVVRIQAVVEFRRTEPSAAADERLERNRWMWLHGRRCFRLSDGVRRRKTMAPRAGSEDVTSRARRR